MSITARPTTYKGIEMRSRLEAAFAQHLDAGSDCGEWQYEPRCYADETGQYLPDFAIGSTIFYEVKPPSADFSEALKRMHIIRSTHPRAALCVVTQYDQHESFYSKGLCLFDDPCDHCRPPSIHDLVQPGWTGYRFLKPTEALRCPGCGSDALHVKSANEIRLDTNAYDSGALVRFSCENCSTLTALSFQNHKGQGYVEVTTHTLDDQ